MIVEGNSRKPTARVWMHREVMVELVRFIGLCPLSFMSFRGNFDSMVTASDASTSGGGIARSQVRGDIPEELEMTQILSVGLFDGIGALRVTLDAIKALVAWHISVESNPEARRVVESNFPDCEHVEDVTSLDWDMVHAWSFKYSSVGLVLVGAGPPRSRGVRPQ